MEFENPIMKHKKLNKVAEKVHKIEERIRESIKKVIQDKWNRRTKNIYRIERVKKRIKNELERIEYLEREIKI